MIPLFLGLTAVNLLLLATVFGVGVGATDPQGKLSDLYLLHLILGTISGLICALTHMVVYTYFMATCKWLHAATDKAALNPNLVAGAFSRKTRALIVVLSVVLLTGITMFTGAGTDPTMNRLWSPQIHLLLATAALAANLAAAWIEYGLIADQGRLMNKMLAILNNAAA